MIHFNKKFSVFCLVILLNSSYIFSQQLSLKVVGNDQVGFKVDIYNGNQLVATNTEEFSLQMYNLDLSTAANMQHWTGQEWKAMKRSSL